MAEENKNDQRDLTVREEHDGSAVVVFTDDAASAAGKSAEGTSGEAQAAPPAATGDDDENEEIILSAAEADGKTEEEREEIRNRRRAERAHRKQVRKEREEMMSRQLESERQARQQLEQRLAAIEQRNTGSEMAQLEHAIKEAADASAYFKNQIAVAAAKNDGVGIADATEKMILARQRSEELTNVKNAYLQRQAQPTPLDPRLLNHAQQWLDGNKWYDPNGRDEDSRIMRVVDDGVKADGYDPTTKEYWDELTRRAKERFPHRYGTSAPKQSNGGGDSKPRSHVTGSDRSASQTPAGDRFEFKLSAERVAAIKEAGAWEDPVKRNKMIENYRKYDAQHNR